MKSNTIYYLNVLRLFACLLVVLSHVVGTALESYYMGLTELQINLLSGIHKCIRWHVPVFVMISGSLFLDSDRSIPIKKLQKYITRIFLGIILWGWVYHIIRIIMENRGFEISYVSDALLSVVENEPFSHLWYLYMILGLYIIQPVLFQFVCNVPRNIVLLFTLVLFLFTSVFPAFEGFLDISIYNIEVFPIAGSYVMYFLLGHLLSKHSMEHRYAVIIAVGFILTHFVLSFICQEAYLFQYGSPLIVLSSCSVFYLAKVFDVGMIIADKLGKLCYGVYICHGFAFQFWYRFLGFTPIKINWVLSIFGGLCFTILVTFLAVYLMRKQKLLCRIL